jgi:hypothetical protein
VHGSGLKRALALSRRRKRRRRNSSSPAKGIMNIGISSKLNADDSGYSDRHTKTLGRGLTSL